MERQILLDLYNNAHMMAVICSECVAASGSSSSSAHAGLVCTDALFEGDREPAPPPLLHYLN